MDLNPTFGRQELISTLSQGSRSKSPSEGSRKEKSSTSSSKGAADGTSASGGAHVEEAYRRLGTRLSLQAHGDDSSRSRRAPRELFVNRNSSFDRYHTSPGRRSSGEGEASHPQEIMLGRGPVPEHVGVAYNHGKSGSITRKMTVEAKALFDQWQAQTAAFAKQEASIISQQHALSKLEIGEGTDALRSRTGSEARRRLRGGSSVGGQNTRNRLLGVPPPTKGLLSAVLEGHSDSNTSGSAAHAGDRSSHSASASQSISTKDSRTATSSVAGNVATGSVSSMPPAARGLAVTRGPCLTSPGDGVANEGLDNVEGNLIVFEKDVINVPRKNLHTIGPKQEKPRSVEYVVQSLLGQGTFAQVFKCLHVQSGNVVAVKIVKNKSAYTRQATVEIDVFRALQDDRRPSADGKPASRDYMVNLMCYFMHRSHLCLVFELLGLNLYEVLKRRQFRGLPLSSVRDIIQQAVSSVRDLSQKSIVHCDLKPENILLVSDEVGVEYVSAGDSGRPESSTTTVASSGSGSKGGTSSGSSSGAPTILAGNQDMTTVSKTRKMKLIDFGSACFEGYTAHTYIQSRFYRSPEVLVGLPYDSAIDMWSLGCVAAELFLGLPILPGVHEHDQLGRIAEMLSKVPDWMLDQGSKSTKFFIKFVSRPSPSEAGRTPSPGSPSTSPAPTAPQWRLKTQQEFIASLSQSEIRKRGGKEKLEKQPGNRYFRRKKLVDILMLHAQSLPFEEKDLLLAFIHFLYGILDPDPWKRWTAFQAVQHPFITGDLNQLRTKTPEMIIQPKEENHANLELDVYWRAPWDPAICRRKLLNVQKMRERQQSMRRNLASRPVGQVSTVADPSSEKRRSRRNEQSSPTSNLSAMADRAAVFSRPKDRASPPNQISTSGSSTTSHSLQAHVSQGLPSQQERIATFGGSSSLSSLGQPHSQSHVAFDGAQREGYNVAVASVASSMGSGPQSFSSGFDAIRGSATEGDFALALQRPGVFPGGNESVASSHYSQQSYDGMQPGVGLQQPTSTSSLPGAAFGQLNSMQGVSPSSFAGPGLSFEGDNAVHQYAPSTRYSGYPSATPSTGQASLYGTSPMLSSANSSLTAPDAFYGDAQRFRQQEQTAFFQQQQQQYGMPPSSGGWPAQQAAPQQQFSAGTQQPQLSFQQQPFGSAAQLAPSVPYSAQPQQQHIGLPQHYPSTVPLPPQFTGQRDPLPGGPGQPVQAGGGVMFQPQQPIYLAEAPGGGMYYVTTSATGQPIILQPVAMLNQPAQPGHQGGGQHMPQYPPNVQYHSGAALPPNPSIPPSAQNSIQQNPSWSSQSSQNQQGRSRRRHRSGQSM